MKRSVMNVFFGLLFLTGVGILMYPAAADQWNTYRQNRLIASYADTVKALKPKDYAWEWDAANAYNDFVRVNNLRGEGPGEEDVKYREALNPGGNGIMGYLSVPKINIRLAIYHGTQEKVLQTGVGHLSGTKLPIGGESTHSVLASHRGIPGARLFTDIDQMVQGDRFYLCILDKVLAYEVDQILAMVDKDDIDVLSRALQITEGEDYVTLFTCTPYGVNSHRLLVRGTRVPYEGEEEPASSPTEVVLRAVRNDYMPYLISGLLAVLLMILLLKFLFSGLKTGISKQGE